MLLDVDSGVVRELSIAGLSSPFVSDPTWVNGGKEIAFVTRIAQTARGGRVWIVSAAGGPAKPLTDESVQALFPTFTGESRVMAYFAPDANGRMQVWKQEFSTTNTAAQSPVRMTNHADVTPTRIRWIGDGSGHLVDQPAILKIVKPR